MAGVAVELEAGVAVAAVGRVLVHAAPVVAAGIGRAMIPLAAYLQLAVKLVPIGALLVFAGAVVIRMTGGSNAPSYRVEEELAQLLEFPCSQFLTSPV